MGALEHDTYLIVSLSETLSAHQHPSSLQTFSSELLWRQEKINEEEPLLVSKEISNYFTSHSNNVIGNPKSRGSKAASGFCTFLEEWSWQQHTSSSQYHKQMHHSYEWAISQALRKARRLLTNQKLVLGISGHFPWVGLSLFWISKSCKKPMVTSSSIGIENCAWHFGHIGSPVWCNFWHWNIPLCTNGCSQRMHCDQ